MFTKSNGNLKIVIFILWHISVYGAGFFGKTFYIKDDIAFSL